MANIHGRCFTGGARATRNCGYGAAVSTTAVLAAIDAVVAVALLLSALRTVKNRLAVLAVATVLLGVSAWLAVLAATPEKSAPPAPAPPMRQV